MLEINNTYTYKLEHPVEPTYINVVFSDKKMLDIWLEYLRYFDEYLHKIKVSVV